MAIHKTLSFLFLVYIISIKVISARQLNIIILDKTWICDIKRSCVDCLRLSQCSWCPSANKCFSDKLPHYRNYCIEDKVRQYDYGMSLEENAKCACDPSHLASEKNCQEPGASVDCSGRGTCLCGRCLCDNIPDPNNPSKTIIGEYCQYDNFSCNETRCNEGPYNINDLQVYVNNIID